MGFGYDHSRARLRRQEKGTQSSDVRNTHRVPGRKNLNIAIKEGRSETLSDVLPTNIVMAENLKYLITYAYLNPLTNSWSRSLLRNPTYVHQFNIRITSTRIISIWGRSVLWRHYTNRTKPASPIVCSATSSIIEICVETQSFHCGYSK